VNGFTIQKIRVVVEVAFIIALVSGCAGMDPIEKRPPGIAKPVTALLPVSVNTLQLRIQEKKQPSIPPFDRFSLAPASDSVFPDDFQLRAHTNKNPILVQYVAKDPSLRRNDFYLWDPQARYWQSEYFYRQAPAEFRTSFIIHLEAAGPNTTRIEILEYLPMVRVGKTFRVTGHSGPGFYDDIRDVEPTTSERAELLRAIQATIH
jgi:hypothetical protein